MGIIREIKEWAGQKINGVSFNWDVVGGCCLACPSCAVGSIGTPRSHGNTSIELFKQILDKAEDECIVRKIQMYAYTDPCLHPQLDVLVAEATRRGIRTNLSTMLQTTKCDWDKLIEARPSEMRISFPGWKKMSYYQSKAAKPEVFDRNFARVMKLPRHKETEWYLTFHLYNDNGDELERARKLAEDNGLTFVRLPAIMMVCEKVVEGNYTPADEELKTHLLEQPEDSIARMKQSDYCMNWKQVTLDSEGYVYLCQLVYEQRFRMMRYLDQPLSAIQTAIRNHSFCGKCMAKGGHIYQECFADFSPDYDPIAVADKKRRKDPNYKPEQNLR